MDNVLQQPIMVADSGTIVKMEVDYSTTCDEKIPQCKELAKKGDAGIKEALDALLALEKQTRTGADTVSTGRVLVAIVQICYDAGKLTELNDNVVTLTKRRSQLKQAVTKMVQECCSYVDQIKDKETKLKLINTLRNVTEGKIYVEVERARLTHKLSLIKEADGDITEAATILQELQVETYGSMEKKEKVELILEQMRLCLAKKDYIRTQIISKKISQKFFEDPAAHQLKLRYFKLMIELNQHEGSYLSICKHYRAILNTPVVQEDAEERKRILRHVVLYLVLSPYDNEQADLTQRVKVDSKDLETIPRYKELLDLFTTSELINWGSLCSSFDSELKKGSVDSPPTDVFDINTEEGKKRWRDLKDRVVEHNILIMAKYYTRINLQRMAELLDLSVAESEEFLSGLVVNGSVRAKTDRLASVVHFTPDKDPNDILNEWSSNVTALMNLVNRTTHLINKEEMVHKHLLATPKE